MLPISRSHSQLTCTLLLAPDAQNFQSLCEHVKPTNHTQSVRFLIFKLLDLLIARFRHTALRQLGVSFLRGYLALAKGEKDPRNLMLLFATDRVLLIDFAAELSEEANRELIEQFFDITFCYFPITFRPPPDDPYGITSADLKAALRGCLTAHPLLAPHALPLLLEKLSATGGGAKRDTLETLRDALPVYGRAAAQAHEGQLWENLKIEILHATERETSVAAQQTLVSLLAVLYTIPAPLDPPAGLAPKIMAQMLAELESPDKILAAPAASVVACLVKAGAPTAYLALYGAMGRLLQLFKDPEEIGQRGPILNHITTLLRAMRASYEGDAAELSQAAGWSRVAAAAEAAAGEKKLDFDVAPPALSASGGSKGKLLSSMQTFLPARSYEGDRRPLDSLRDALLAALHNGIRSASYRSSALAAFVQLCHIPGGLLGVQELNYLAEAVNELLIGQPQSSSAAAEAGDEVRRLAMRALVELAKINQRALEETTLPLLLEKLPDQMLVPAPPTKEEAPGEDVQMGGTTPLPSGSSSSGAKATGPTAEEIKQRLEIRHALAALSCFGTQANLFDILIVKLLTKFDLVVLHRPRDGDGAGGSARQRSASIAYARGLINCLFSIAREKERRGDRDLGKFAISSMPRLLTTMLSHHIDPSSEEQTQSPPVAADDSLIRDVAGLLMLFVRNLALDKQKELARKVFQTLEQGQVFELVEQPRLRRKPGVESPYPFFAPLAIASDTLPAASSSYSQQRDAWFLLASLIIPLSKEASLPYQGDVLGWVERQLAWIQSAASPLQFDAAALSLASCMNKHVPEPVPAEVQSAIEKYFSTALQAPSRRQRLLALRCWLFITKGLALRTSKLADSCIDKAFQLCEDESIGHDAARALEILVQQDEHILTKANGHTIRLLYRQRLFSTLLPKVTNGYRGSIGKSPHQQSVYLTALTALLPHMPKSTTGERLKELFPLLIRALDLPDAETRASAASTIAIAVITAHIEKRKAEEEEVQTKTRRVASGGSADFSSSAVAGQVAISLAEDHIGSLITRLLAMIEPATNDSEVSGKPNKAQLTSAIDTISLSTGEPSSGFAVSIRFGTGGALRLAAPASHQRAAGPRRSWQGSRRPAQERPSRSSRDTRRLVQPPRIDHTDVDQSCLRVYHVLELLDE